MPARRERRAIIPLYAGAFDTCDVAEGKCWFDNLRAISAHRNGLVTFLGWQGSRLPAIVSGVPWMINVVKHQPATHPRECSPPCHQSDLLAARYPPFNRYRTTMTVVCYSLSKDGLILMKRREHYASS